MPRDVEQAAVGDGRTNWDVALAVIGAGAALAGWIAVVGGAVVWARLHAAHIPATQTLSVLPRNLLIVEGLQTLLVPLLIGAGVALLVYYSWLDQSVVREVEESGRTAIEKRRENKEKKKEQEEKQDNAKQETIQVMGESPPENRVRLPAPLVFLVGLIDEYKAGPVAIAAVAVAVVLAVLTLAIAHVNWWVVIIATAVAAILLSVGLGLSTARGDQRKAAVPLLVLAAVTAIGGVIVALALVMKVSAVMWIVLVTIAAIYLTLGALVRRSRLGVALTLFAAFALWAGALGFLSDLGAKVPKLETAVVERTSGAAEAGFYLGGAGGDVYIATVTQPRRVKLIKKDDVASLSFGPAIRVSPKKTAPEKQELSEPKGSPGAAGSGGNHKKKAKPPAPLIAADRVVASANGHLDSVPVRLDVMKPHRGDRLMVLNLRLTNLSTRERIPRPLIIGSLLDDGEVVGEPSNQRETLDGLTLADLDNGRHLLIARDTRKNCLCSSQLSRIAVEPGQAVKLYVTFAPPPADKFELQVPGFGSIPVVAGA